MNVLRKSLRQYVALRRALGTKLREPAATLERFVDFLEREKAAFITLELALRWASNRKVCAELHGRGDWAWREDLLSGSARLTPVPRSHRIGSCHRDGGAISRNLQPPGDWPIDERGRPACLANGTPGVDLHNSHRASHGYLPPPRGGSGLE